VEEEDLGMMKKKCSLGDRKRVPSMHMAGEPDPQVEEEYIIIVIIIIIIIICLLLLSTLLLVLLLEAKWRIKEGGEAERRIKGR
jgi:flagellar basal body-associated protein FliL